MPVIPDTSQPVAGPAQEMHLLLRTFGPAKPMGESAPSVDRPHFFLHRNFLGEQDLAILFNTKRCRYQCKFCALPRKSSRTWIPESDVVAQFSYVINELKNSLGVLDRLTIANEGSVLDDTTFPVPALDQIVSAAAVLPRLRKIVLETRMEFVTESRLREIETASGKRLDILTGFESHDPYIREHVLGKSESLDVFAAGLDIVARIKGDLTAYVLFKPDPEMSDQEAAASAEESIDYLQRFCRERHVPLTIRLNPMYVASGTPWAKRAESMREYRPPRLSDVMTLAEKKRSKGLAVYVGLTSEGLSDPDMTYRGRDDFNRGLLKRGIMMNGDGSVVPAQHLQGIR